MIKAIILDLDDTLCLTEEACYRLENETLKKMGRKPMPRKIHLSTWGKPLFEIMPVRSPGINIDEFRVIFEPLIKKAISRNELDVISAENLQTIDSLIAENKILLVLTSREHLEVKHLLGPEHPLSKKLLAFYYRDNMKYHKPDPRAFEHIELEHGWKPEECVYVGDSLNDAKAAKGAGLHFVASLESGLKTRNDFADYSVDEFINTFPELISAIGRIDSRL